MSDVPARLLREMLRGRMATEPSPGCIDTDTLAAWSDGTLSARERAAAESHASGCVRCQALLAAMARTALPAPARRWWRTSRLGWLVPLAAAVVVVMWINIPKTTRLEPSAPLPASAAAASQPAVPAAAPPVRQTRADEERVAAKDAAQSALPEVPQAKAKGALDAAVAPPPAAPPTAATSSVDEMSQRAAARESAPVSTRDTSPAAAPPPQTPARAMADVAASVPRAEALERMVLARTQIVSPNPNIRWRLLPGGGVERSIDGGTTWQVQSTGAPVTLTAGAAPSPTTCWLVGPGGIVLLSIDGRTWQRISIPETIDLRFISASDAANATVTAADGRTFATLDGGKTWRLQ